MAHQQDTRSVLLASRRRRYQTAVLWREIRRLSGACDGPQQGVAQREIARAGDRLSGAVERDLAGRREAESVTR